MVNRLPSWFFLAVSLVLMGFALMPLARVAIGVDQQFSVQFMTVVMFLIGGLMSGLSAMILLVRRAPKLNWTNEPQASNTKKLAISLHASGLLLYTAIPLLNFLVCYWLWIRNRTESREADRLGQEALNFQITIYLYLLLSLFMVLALIGLFSTPLILLFHAISTLIAMVCAMNGKFINYPLNIPIIQGRATATD